MMTNRRTILAKHLEAAALTEQRVNLLRPKYQKYLGSYFNQLVQQYDSHNLGEYFPWALEQIKKEVTQRLIDINGQLERQSKKDENGNSPQVMLTDNGPTIVNVPPGFEHITPEELAWRTMSMDNIVNKYSSTASYRTLKHFSEAKNKKDPRVEKLLGTWDINRLTPAQLEQLRNKYPEVYKRRELFVEDKDHPAGAQVIRRIKDNQGHEWSLAKIEGWEDAQAEACKIYGERSRWCTTVKETAKGYLAEGPLYVILKDGAPVMQYSPSRQELQDLENNPVEIDEVPALKTLMQGLVPYIGSDEWIAAVDSRLEAIHEIFDGVAESYYEPSNFSRDESYDLHEEIRRHDSYAELVESVRGTPVESTLQTLEDLYESFEDVDDWDEWKRKAINYLERDGSAAYNLEEYYKEMEGFIKDLRLADSRNDVERALDQFNHSVLTDPLHELVSELLNAFGG